MSLLHLPIPPRWEQFVTTLRNSSFGNVPIFELVIAALALFHCSHFVKNARINKKGPVMWPVVGMLPAVLVNLQRIYDWSTDSLLDCGGNLWFDGLWLAKMQAFWTCKPENVEYILRTHFDNFPKGDCLHEILHDMFGEGIFNADHEQWRFQRKMASIELHSLRFRRFNEETVKRLVEEKLIPVLTLASERRMFIDLQDILLRYTFDNVCIATVGEDPGFLSTNFPEIPFAMALERATDITTLRFIMPQFLWKGLRVLNLGPERELQEALQIINQYALSLIAARKKQFGNNNRHVGGDLLSCFLQQEKDDQFLRDVLINFIVAGRDTSAVALSWFFWLLFKNPHVEEKLLQEISATDKKGESFTKEELQSMQYLHAALSETLRLHPSVPFESKQMIKDDKLPDGTKLKAGTRVFFSIYAMGRMEKVWGDDCLSFKPERWLKEGKFINESGLRYVPFNGGPRLCLGKDMAYLQMKAAAAAILERFEVHVKPGYVVTPKLSLLHFMKYGLEVMLVARKKP